VYFPRWVLPHFLLIYFIQHPKFVFDMVVLSVCSAVGQLFIYHTIDVFGPVVFTIIMTLRQVSYFSGRGMGFVYSTV